MMAAAVVILIILTAVEVLILHLSFFLFENLKLFCRFAAELRGVAYDLAEFIDKTSVFRLDSTTNR